MPLPSSDLLWLALLCSPPLVMALVFALCPRKSVDTGSIRLGNPLLKPGSVPTLQTAALRPLLQLTRMESDADLRALVLGLRHMPLQDTAAILRRYQRSADPELQIYSQSILQEKQERLQAAFARLLPRAAAESPALLASFIEAGLDLMDSPLTPEPEKAAILRKLSPKVQVVCDSPRFEHPRAVCAAARFCLLTRQLEPAQDLAARLPAGSPLREFLEPRLRHHAAIQQPPPQLTSRYSIQ